jgi:tRNA modification GTPase
MERRDTIFALASGAPPAGIAVIRISGDAVRFGLETMAGGVPPARQATLRRIRAAGSGDELDRGLVLFFPAPASFTGEDMAELHLHGGRAVVAAVLRALGDLAGFRPAEAGEFTRRAFRNGRADLTEVEGLADLVAAETEMQRRQALRQAEGGLRRLYEDWRERLVRARALIEAELDFADEADVPPATGRAAEAEIAAVRDAIERHLDDGRRGERVREGFVVVLMGAPNVGKSSLLNALARRDVAIVTEEPGTTRDLIEVALDLGGYAVTLVDTAGLRATASRVEEEGIERARRRGAAADLVLWLEDGRDDGETPPADRPVLRVRTKGDLLDSDSKRRLAGLIVSATTGAGLDALQAAVAKALDLARPMPSVLVTRERQRRGLADCAAALQAAATVDRGELQAELLRQAADGLGRVTGRIDVEDWLGVIFSEFCIGK